MINYVKCTDALEISDVFNNNNKHGYVSNLHAVRKKYDYITVLIYIL